MDKKLKEELKEKLEKQKANIEEALKEFATKDEKVEDDWDTRFPNLGSSTGGQDLETAADEVEEYSTLLPIEYSLEKQLKNVNSALEKLESGTYGQCEKCKKQINEERVKAYPSAPLCMNCENKEE